MAVHWLLMFEQEYTRIPQIIDLVRGLIFNLPLKWVATPTSGVLMDHTLMSHVIMPSHFMPYIIMNSCILYIFSFYKPI